MANDERTLLKYMLAGQIERRDMEGLKHGIVKLNPDGTNPAGLGKFPVQLQGDAERKYVICPVHLRQYVKHNSGVWCKRNKQSLWEIEKLDAVSNEIASSGAGGMSFAGGNTHTRTPVGAPGGSGSGDRTGLRYGGTGTDLSGANNGLVYKLGSILTTHKHNLIATTDPTTGDNAADGYGIGSLWYNTSTNELFVYVFEVTGVAVWELINGSGTGTVTSVALTLPSEFSVTGSPVTGSGTLAGAWTTQTTNKVFVAPNGSTGTPTFRLLAAADIPVLTTGHIPALPAGQITSGQIALARGGTGADLSATGGANQFVKQTSAGGNFSVDAISASDITSALTTPPAIGGTTPAAGTFTTLTANSRMILPSIATPGTPAEGDLWIDTTQKVLTSFAGGIKTFHSGVLFVATADGSAAASGSDTAMEGSGVGSLTIEGNRWVAGSTIEWEMWGRLNTDNTTNSRALIIALKYGSTELVNQAISFTNNYGTGNEPNGRGFHVKGSFTVRTGGATGTGHASIWMQIDGLTPRLTPSLLVSSLDFTTDTTLSFVGRWTSYASGDTATAKMLRVSQLI